MVGPGPLPLSYAIGAGVAVTEAQLTLQTTEPASSERFKAMHQHGLVAPIKGYIREQNKCVLLGVLLLIA